MKLRIFLPLFVFLLVSVSSVPAHPPTEVVLKYNLETQQLLIEGKHKTDDPEKDYVKKMVFYRNGEEIKTEYLQRQYGRLNISSEVSLSAEEGDQIQVKIYSAEGGSKTVELTVTADVMEDEASSEE